ncbi:MAG: methyltransferase domain-containing protein [Sulfolobales archaeon]
MYRKSYRDLVKDHIPPDLYSKLPRSFDVIGDIALIKLPDELIPYAPQISEAIMRIHRNVRSVYVRKRVSGVYRVHELIFAGGVEKSETIYTENGVRFYVDIKKMFVNPRMATERLRIAGMIRDGELVLDLFSGYGGFSLNIARLREVFIVAVDLNPEAINALRRSIELNKLKGYIEPIHAEARFLVESLREGIFDVIILDNPTMIESFVECIARLLKDRGRVYMYVLTKDIESFRDRVERIGLEVRECIDVREYSPEEYIYRCEVYKKRFIS